MLWSLLTAFGIAVMVALTNFTTKQRGEEFFTPRLALELLAITAITFALLMTLVSYIYFIRGDLKKNKRLLPIIYTSLILSFAICLIFGTFVNIYVIPLTLSALLVATLVDKRAGIITNVLTSLVFFLANILLSSEGNIRGSAVAILTSIVAGVFIIIFLGKASARLKFIILGAIVGLCSSILPILVNILSPGVDAYDALMSGVWTFLSVMLAVALYMLLLPMLEYAFKADTNYRLAEISSFEFPLLKKLAEEAPGTFNHSLVVGNLAELCAAAIGENSLLAKASAYYHDVGKMKNPEFFVENQKGYNPHDDLIPEVSIKMITSHTSDGYKIIKKHGLPDTVADVAREHHGTTPVNYFLYKAQNLTESDLDSTEFSYPDPLPSNKISAIIMIVDTVEAATRAMSGTMTNAKEFRDTIRKLIKEKADLNQFSNCNITFSDLQKIEDTLVESVPNMYHARIRYTVK